ncbi:MAG: acetate--CoA ligase family protein, partial [Anaerolineales bacterium]
GIFVEIFEESQVRVAPLTQSTAQEMIENLRGYQILAGARGHRPVDIESVVETLLRISQLLTDFPEIQELDINPMRVFHEGEGCSALDARIIVG